MIVLNEMERFKYSQKNGVLSCLCFSAPGSGSVEVCEPPAGDSVHVQSE